jgi:hypothetical protein
MNAKKLGAQKLGGWEAGKPGSWEAGKLISAFQGLVPYSSIHCMLQIGNSRNSL